MTQRPQTQPHAESGFVLPYVLVVIAILAIAGTIAAQRLQKASAIVGEMQDRVYTERVLLSAEAAATYSLLTGNQGNGGYDLSPESPIVWEFGLLSPDGRRPLREDAAGKITKNLWRGDGSLRRYALSGSGRATDAIVSYRDAAGLLPLSEGNPDFLLPVLEAVGAPRPQARDMLAALADYVDPDERKRPNGAESFNYRTQNLTPPTNAPLRSYRELARVMGWEETMRSMDMTSLKSMTTLNSGASYREAFAPESLRQIIGLNDAAISASQKLDIFEQIELKNSTSSQRARFTIWAPRSDGRFRKRVVDVERFLGGIDTPYRRHWVYDSTVLESDFVPYVGAPIIAQNGPLKFDELDHVVHASSLRP